MAAPTPTARVRPTGIKLENGYRTLLVNALKPNIDLFEESVTPIGADVGEPIGTSDMFNDEWETQAPRPLKKGTPGTAVCNFDPAVWDDVLAILGKRTTITEINPNGDKMAFYGYYKDMVKGPQANGTQPKMTVTYIPTMEDPITHQEESPVFVPFVGTGDPFATL